MRATSYALLATVAALAVATVLVASASALTISTAAITFLGVTLDGTDQTVTGSTSAWQADANGETGGWNVTVASTDFDNGAGKTIAVANFEVRLVDANIVRVSGDVNKPTSTQTTYTSLSGTALKIASAAVGEGWRLRPDTGLSADDTGGDLYRQLYRHGDRRDQYGSIEMRSERGG